MLALTRAAILTLTLASASASATSIAARTAHIDFPFDQVLPLPTQAPAAVPRHHLLAARQNAAASSKTTAYVGPDNICGYIEGRPGASLYCPAGANCVLFTAQPTMTGAVACCNTDSCNLRLTCLDYNQVISQSLCDNGCMVDAFTLKCTNSLRPYCNTASFSSSIIDYWCNDASISTPQPVLTAYSGQTADRSFKPLVLGETTSLAIPSSTIEDGPEVTPGPSASHTPTPDPDPPKPKKKSNAGAIAGGVVGGIAALGLLALAAFFLFRKRKTPPAAAAAPAPAPAPTGPQQPQMNYAPGQHPQSVYNPAYAQPGQFTTTPPPQGFDPSKGVYYAPVPAPVQTAPSPDGSNPQDPNRVSTVVTSPALSSVSGGFAPYQQGAPQPMAYGPGQQAPIHEAGGNPVDHHRGQMHELA